MEKFQVVLGAVLLVLNAFGIVTADESAKLLDYSISTVSGSVGIYLIVKEVIKRLKQKKAEREALSCGEAKAPLVEAPEKEGK